MYTENTEIITLAHTAREDYNYNEAMKTLRTNIQFCGSNIKKIMLTSAMPDEGKTDIAVSLANSLAQIGKKTLFIDADIRKSILAARFRVGVKIHGLSQYLSGQKTLEQVIYHTSDENLDMIFAGPYSPNPAELLEEELLEKLLEAAGAYYDYIIIDTPPMANLIDGAIIAKQCDGAVMVIESGAISYRIEQKVKVQLEKSGCRILGAILNKVDLHKDKYYGRYGKYSRYGRYGRYQKYEKYEIGEEKAR